jgi:hypothetical protein
MSGGKISSAGGNGPSGRAVRVWLGLLLSTQFIVQFAAVDWAWQDANRFRPLPAVHTHGPMSLEQMLYGGEANNALYWRAITVATGEALLAIVTLVAGTGLILNAAWAGRLASLMAVGQILMTVVTQAWEVMATPEFQRGFTDYQPVGFLILLGLIGTVIWSIVPVGILVLSVTGRPKGGAKWQRDEVAEKR